MDSWNHETHMLAFKMCVDYNSTSEPRESLGCVVQDMCVSFTVCIKQPRQLFGI